MEQLQLDQTWAGLSCVCVSKRAKEREGTLNCEAHFSVVLFQ